MLFICYEMNFDPVPHPHSCVEAPTVNVAAFGNKDFQEVIEGK